MKRVEFDDLETVKYGSLENLKKLALLDVYSLRISSMSASALSQTGLV